MTHIFVKLFENLKLTQHSKCVTIAEKLLSVIPFLFSLFSTEIKNPNSVLRSKTSACWKKISDHHFCMKYYIENNEM